MLRRSVRPMNLHAMLLGSMMDWCDRSAVLNRVAYTAAMMVLGLSVSLNLLSVFNLLWTLGILANPYFTAGRLSPQRYVYAALCIGLAVNMVLARRNFVADRECLHLHPQLASPEGAAHPLPRRTGPFYLLGSIVLFLATLALDLMPRR
jgi:hypothetical protein